MFETDNISERRYVRPYQLFTEAEVNSVINQSLLYSCLLAYKVTKLNEVINNEVGELAAWNNHRG